MRVAIVSWSCVLLTLATPAAVAQTLSPSPSPSFSLSPAPSTTVDVTLPLSPPPYSPSPTGMTQPSTLSPSPPSFFPAPVSPPSPSPSSPVPLASTLNLYGDTGIFELCDSRDCNADDASLSFSLSKVSLDTTIDYATNTVASSTVLADLGMMTPTDTDHDGIPDPLITRANGSSSHATLYARVCLSTVCTPRASNASEFQRLRTSRDDAIGIQLDVRHTQMPTTIVSPFETYDVARGALRLNLSVAISPLAGQPDVVPMFSLTFLVAAFERGVATSSVSISSFVDGHMYLERVRFGSGMFLDLPVYATVNNVDTPIYTAIQAHRSDELQDLVEVTLLFGPVTQSIGYVAALSSDKLVASDSAAGTGSMASTSTPTPTPTLTSLYQSPLRDSTGKALPTRMRTGPRGAFGLCLDATCAADDVLTVGFAGLRTTGSVDLRLDRFANAPAFQLSAPSTAMLAGTATEVLTNFFEASVPQSRVRPPRPYTGGNGNDATLTANLTYFLTPGSVPYGGKQLDVPRGAIKFTIAIYNWSFAAASDRLDLSMAVQLTRNGSSTTSGVAVNVSSLYTVAMVGDTVVVTLEHDKVLEFPTYAIADDAVVPVGVAVAPQDATGAVLVVTFSFASFAQALVYDPVIKATNATTTTAPVVVLDEPKRQVGSWAVAGFLLGFLALVILVSILQCIKKARVKIDFSKIIP